jgi:hypothetical protein
MKNNKVYDKLQAVRGCSALVHLMQNCLPQYKAIDGFSGCDRVTELNERAELTTLSKTLIVLISWTSLHDESKVGINAIGGVEAIFRVLLSLTDMSVALEV